VTCSAFLAAIESTSFEPETKLNVPARAREPVGAPEQQPACRALVARAAQNVPNRSRDNALGLFRGEATAGLP